MTQKYSLAFLFVTCELSLRIFFYILKLAGNFGRKTEFLAPCVRGIQLKKLLFDACTVHITLIHSHM